MQFANVQAVIDRAPKGANIVLEWTRPCKTRKGVTNAVAKAVRMVGRVGLTYDNIGAVVEKRQNGELPAENAGLPAWAEWVQYPYIIRNRTSGQLYLRLYKGTSDKVRPMVRFLIDGNEASREAVAPLVLKSEVETDHDSECFMVKIEALNRVYSDTAEYGSLWQ